MATVILIPARLASTRLPEKMLLDKTKWPLIRHTYTQAKKSKLAARVIVATDDKRIEEVVQAFGGEVIMTSPTHPTGSDRLAEVASRFLQDEDLIVNVQGDDPEITPAHIDLLIELYEASKPDMATLVAPFGTTTTSPVDPNRVKVVLGAPILGKTQLSNTMSILGHHALYFSRSLIPYPRATQGNPTNFSDYFMHIGIYAYRASFLKKFVKLPQGRLESVESLEQLRILENGYKIVASVVEYSSGGIDTLADYEQFVQRFHANNP